MKATAIAGVTAAWVGLLLLGTSARALADASACESSKLRTAGRYAACRLTVSAGATGGAPNFNACNARFLAKWRRAETKGMGRCPSTGGQPAIQAFIIQSAEGVGDALAAGALPSCAAGAGTSTHPARSGADECEDRKLGVAAKYYACRLHAAAGAVRTGSGALDSSVCDARFAAASAATRCA
jgi:hypothetical protein